VKLGTGNSKTGIGVKKETINELQKTALQLRLDLIEMIGVGKAGHLGGSSSLAEIVSTLYFHQMRFDPRNPDDPDRDRFLLSKGHAVLIQYAALVELGVIPRSELKRVKNLGSPLQGHPDMEATPGIEAVTGSLGQGLSIAAGMALALRLDGRSARVYVIVGDGELAEGQLWEAAMAAYRFRIDNLTAVVDHNRIQASGPTSEVFEIPYIEQKWKSFGWNVIAIDGHDLTAIIGALEAAEKVKGKPTVIVAETIKGKGISFAENTSAFHNAVLSEAQYHKAVAELQRQIRDLEMENREAGL
jgi:transketolase